MKNFIFLFIEKEMQVKDCLWEGTKQGHRKYTIDDFVGRTVSLSIAKHDHVFRINGIMFNDKMKQVWYCDFPIDKLPEFGESLLCKLVILDFPPHNYCFFIKKNFSDSKNPVDFSFIKEDVGLFEVGNIWWVHSKYFRTI